MILTDKSKLITNDDIIIFLYLNLTTETRSVGYVCVYRQQIVVRTVKILDNIIHVNAFRKEIK